MKNILILLLIFISAGCGYSQNNKPATAQSKEKLEVIYFHATNRCASCKAIEARTKETLETYFKKELENGSIKLSVYNVDEEKNQALAEKYQAYGATLILTSKKAGKEEVKNMTNLGFSKARTDGQAFMTTLKDEIATLL